MRGTVGLSGGKTKLTGNLQTSWRTTVSEAGRRKLYGGTLTPPGLNHPSGDGELQNGGGAVTSPQEADLLRRHLTGTSTWTVSGLLEGREGTMRAGRGDEREWGDQVFLGKHSRILEPGR